MVSNEDMQEKLERVKVVLNNLDKTKLYGIIQNWDCMDSDPSVLDQFIGVYSPDTCEKTLSQRLHTKWYDKVATELSRHSKLKRIIDYDFLCEYEQDLLKVASLLSRGLHHYKYNFAEIYGFLRLWLAFYIDYQIEKRLVQFQIPLREIKSEDIKGLGDFELFAVASAQKIEDNPLPRSDSPKWDSVLGDNI